MNKFHSGANRFLIRVNDPQDQMLLQNLLFILNAQAFGRMNLIWVDGPFHSGEWHEWLCLLCIQFSHKAKLNGHFLGFQDTFVLEGIYT